MRLIPLCLLFALIAPLNSAEDDDARGSISAVQTIFDGMASHDAAKIRSAVLPGAQLYGVRGDREPSATLMDDFATRIAAVTGGVLERFTSPPKVLIRGRMAMVWGEYEFLRDGKFNHCGVDNATVFKTAAGWKVATISDTTETTGCPGQ